jgi:cytoskeletal protein CcmA (bactofilin family)
MASTYVNDLRLNEMATGDASGTWGTTTNTNLELIGEALGYGTEGITTNADTHTSTIADGATDPVRAMFVKYTGTLDSACTITIAPNTINRMQFIENGTSGSQNIIISQGSGANITIPAGDTKAVYLDGAGSGAAVVDAFASLNVVDLKVQDDLTVTDDLIVNGDIDLEGAIDVNGTANLDVVDIDGAVDMASTLTVAGVVDVTDTTDSSDASGDTGALRTEGGASIAKKLYVGTDLDVDGTANLDVVDIDGAVDMATTLTLAGNADFNGDLDVDGTTETDALSINGTTITATAAELNYTDGVTSAIQTQLDTKATTGKAIAMALVFG